MNSNAIYCFVFLSSSISCEERPSSLSPVRKGGKTVVGQSANVGQVGEEPKGCCTHRFKR